MAVKKTTKTTIALGLGCKEPEVKKAQEMLAKTGSKIKISGVFTIGMVSAVKKFQKNHNLAVTGIINKKTWDALELATKAVRRTVKPAKK